MDVSRSQLITLAITAVTAAGSAQAGPSVSVTFKNFGAADALYKPVTKNELSTQLNAKSKPHASVKSGGVDSYTVQSNISPDANYASLRYTIGGKTCIFHTTFVAAPGALGSKVPKWKNTATPSGGATCTAKTTARNATTYDWSVEYTMK
ncbi:hypothetical protein [Pseudomonas akapageensis]|uniref:hypothetical protein n=1 Tax=Pseudomonas akapageensis TaxID=2609961 RepID=UPI00140884D5|nr:hypothetical protein [Pseudomonas akapageensis]